MTKQCAGCGKIFDDGSGITNPPGTGTIHGCCDECNASSFRTHPQNEVKAPVATPEPEREIVASPSGAPVSVLSEIPEDSVRAEGETPQQEVIDKEKVQ
jgi:predicted  nucleic acid-binding Zn-ribbon protein